MDIMAFHFPHSPFVSHGKRFLILVGLLVLTGCSSGTPDAVCQEGQGKSCSCDDGSIKSKACEDGEWGACKCDGPLPQDVDSPKDSAGDVIQDTVSDTAIEPDLVDTASDSVDAADTHDSKAGTDSGDGQADSELQDAASDTTDATDTGA
jgi:hypothetical protein